MNNTYYDDKSVVNLKTLVSVTIFDKRGSGPGPQDYRLRFLFENGASLITESRLDLENCKRTIQSINDFFHSKIEVNDL